MPLLKRLAFWMKADRLGPDMPLTHWRLFFPDSLGRKLCRKKFRSFGRDSEFRPGAYAVNCSSISIGNRVVIRPQSMLFGSGRIEIGDGVLIGSGVHIYTANHAFGDRGHPIIDQGHSDSRPVVLEEGCWIGANAVILPGVTVGRNSVVGAGSIVTKPIPEFSVFAGNPAVLVRRIE